MATMDETFYSLNGRALSLCCHRTDEVHPHTEEPRSLQEETFLWMPAKKKRKKSPKNSRNKEGTKIKKEEKKKKDPRK